eukprot:482555_1
MARKYSQYKLPGASELVDSENEDNLGSMIKMDDDDDDEEDEDILSDTLTMLSHKSLSSKPPYALLRKSSSPSQIATKLHCAASNSLNHVHFNPMEEIREIQMDKAYFIGIFDEYFDESKEGDVDLDEFKRGLYQLGAFNSYNETERAQQIEKVFNVLLMHGDGDNSSGYLQSEQFCDFLTRRFEAPHLIAHQDLLLNVIIKNTKKKHSSRHRLMNADDAEEWDTAEVSLTEIEMRQAMEQMVDNEMEKIKVKQAFTEELERRMADPSFCAEWNASSWSCYEVAQWVSSIGYEYAMKRFFDFSIDGNVLLHDVHSTMLVNQLGISSLHCDKFVRHLNELKSKVNCTRLSESHEVNAFEYTSNINIIAQLNESKQRMAALRKMNDSLSDENQRLRDDDPFAFLYGMELNDDDDETDAMDWDCQRVAYWLTTIGMKKYLTQFVDGQILLNDINQANLITDLSVKSLHAPKIMRQINKLRTQKYQITHDVSSVNIASSHHQIQDQLSSLKTDLSQTRVELSAARAQMEHQYNKKWSDPCSPTPPLPTPSLPAEWHQYIGHLEKKHREVTALWMRADNNLKKYSRAIIPFQERIHNLELQNETRKKTIDKLNKRIDRRNQTVNKLKQQMYSSAPPSVASSIASGSPPYHTHHQLTQQQEMWFNNAQREYSAANHHHHSSHSHSQPPGKQHTFHHHHKYNNSDQLIPRKKKRIKVRKTAKHVENMNGYRSAPLNNENGTDSDTSLIGSLTGITSMAYGYIMG